MNRGGARVRVSGTYGTFIMICHVYHKMYLKITPKITGNDHLGYMKHYFFVYFIIYFFYGTYGTCGTCVLEVLYGGV